MILANNNIKLNYELLLRKLAAKEITKEELYTLEKECIDDPFLADAYEGIKNNVGTQEYILSIESKITSNKLTKKRFLSWNMIGIAASIFLLVSFVFLINKEGQKDQKLVNNSAGLSKVTIESESIFKEELNLEINSSSSNTKPSDIIASNDLKKSEPKNIPNKLKKISAPKNLENIDLSKFDQQEAVSLKSSPKKASNHYVDGDRASLLDQKISKSIEKNLAIRRKTLDEVLVAEKKPIVKKQSATSRIKISADMDINQNSLGTLENKGVSQISATTTGIEEEIMSMYPMEGIVLDENENPIIGAYIMVLENENSATTDIDGKFKIATPSFPSTIKVEYVGYLTETRVINHFTETEDIVINLKEAQNNLSEVAVVRHRVTKTNYQPAMGWKAFETLIEEFKSEYKLNVSGSVRITFKIDKYGNLSNFDVIEKNCEPCEIKAIQILQKSGFWMTIPAGQEIDALYQFNF